jgi:hypothetical protein
LVASGQVQQLAVAWTILGAVLVWSYVWKCIALWKAARRDQMGWYVVLAVAPPLFGLLEMIYVFMAAPRVAELGELGEQ